MKGGEAREVTKGTRVCDCVPLARRSPHSDIPTAGHPGSAPTAEREAPALPPFTPRWVFVGGVENQSHQAANETRYL